MVGVHDIVAYIVKRYSSERLTAFKLHKLLYYCQAWSLAWDDEPLFSDNIKGWRNGPVVPEVYRHHPGRLHIQDWPHGDSGKIPDHVVRDTVGPVLAFYGNRSAAALVDLSHREPPWIASRKGVSPDSKSSNVISCDAMREYYGHLAADRGRIPVDEWQDRLRSDFSTQLVDLVDDLPSTVHHDATLLVKQIVEHMVPTPSSVTIAPADGRALFSLFGKDGREADVWVNGSGTMNVVTSDDDDEKAHREKAAPIGDFKLLAKWLSKENHPQ